MIIRSGKATGIYSEWVRDCVLKPTLTSVAQLDRYVHCLVYCPSERPIPGVSGPYDLCIPDHAHEVKKNN